MFNGIDCSKSKNGKEQTVAWASEAVDVSTVDETATHWTTQDLPLNQYKPLGWTWRAAARGQSYGQ